MWCVGAFAEIDWHDYAIVQTIEFTAADADSELPPPMSLQEVENMTLAQKRMAAMVMETTAEDVETLRAKQAQEAAAAAERQSQQEEETAMDESDDEDKEENERKRREEEERQRELERARAIQASSLEAGGPMKIRTDYVPKRECHYPTSQALTFNLDVLQFPRKRAKSSPLVLSVVSKFPWTNCKNTCVSNCSTLAGNHNVTCSKLAKHKLRNCSVVPTSFRHSRILLVLV